MTKRISDDVLRTAMECGSPVLREAAKELLAARVLLREVYLRASSGTGYIPAELENRLRAALNKEETDGN